MNVLELKEV